MTDHPEYLALLRGVLERPRDDAPRLVLADWLEEYGDEGERARAEFIRVQLTLDAAPLVYEVRQGPPRAERIVSGGHGFDAPWLTRFLVNHLHRLPSVGGTLTFRRGFVEEVSLPIDIFLNGDLPARLFACQPVLKVTLTDCKPLHYCSGWWEVYTWAGGVHGETTPYHLPEALFFLLDWSDYTGWASEADAFAALSAACVRLGRRRAELPDLED